MSDLRKCKLCSNILRIHYANNITTHYKLKCLKCGWHCNHTLNEDRCTKSCSPANYIPIINLLRRPVTEAALSYWRFEKEEQEFSARL